MSESLPQTEMSDPRMLSLEEWPTGIAALALWEGQLAAVAAVRQALPGIAAAAEAAASRLRGTQGRLVYCGAGTSGRLGILDGSELAPTFDWPLERFVMCIAGGPAALTHAVENAEDREDLAQTDMAALKLGDCDVVIATAASGATPYAIACARAARARWALTIGIANSPGAALFAECDHAILVETGAEPIAGSTRMKAGTSQKVVLNLLSTLIMVRLGRVFRGQMVDMVARNEKLRRRALRMVMGITGCPEAAARDALAASGGKAKLAILLLHGLDADEALARLGSHGGHLGAALRGVSR
jgi:N-acetylmuramic acid 6-phosphate etherase